MANLTLMFNRAVAVYNTGRLIEAEQLCQRIIATKRNFFDALHLLATIQSRLGKNEEALASYDRALKLRPDHADLLYNCGLTLHQLKRFEEALGKYNQVLKLRPDHADALLNRGGAQYELKRFEEALASYDRALKVRPDHAGTLYNCGLTLHQLQRFEEALASYDRALKVWPDYAQALYDRGSTLHQLKRLEEALASYDRALKVRPDYADGYRNRAITKLLVGQYKEGWADYEWRWETTDCLSKRPGIGVPTWQGEDLSGRHLLVFSEQGLGDMIQFARYLPLLVERECKVTFLTYAQLASLFQSSFQSIEIVSELDGILGVDFQVALMSLPYWFRTESLSIPNNVPYLKVEPRLEARWKDCIRTHSFKIGIAWSGSPTYKNDHDRSINLSLLLPLLDTQATFVSLQKDVRPNDAALLKDQKNILCFGEDLKDFSDTAALISHLDLVISVDTSVAHLAGALGKPIWVLLPFIPDWRWLLDREDSPWYPTASLFRQNDTRVWDDIITRVHGALRELVQNHP